MKAYTRPPSYQNSYTFCPLPNTQLPYLIPTSTYPLSNKMAGYGNRTAPDYTAESLTEEHSNTRLGLTDSHSVRTRPLLHLQRIFRVSRSCPIAQPILNHTSHLLALHLITTITAFSLTNTNPSRQPTAQVSATKPHPSRALTPSRPPRRTRSLSTKKTPRLDSTAKTATAARRTATHTTTGRCHSSQPLSRTRSREPGQHRQREPGTGTRRGVLGMRNTRVSSD